VEGGSEIKTTLEKEKPKEGKSKKVDFNFSAPHAGSISIAGDFNDWNPGSHPMKKDKKEVWKISLNLAPRMIGEEVRFTIIENYRVNEEVIYENSSEENITSG
jgi:1,4-alpha-glucan branching enzyme